MKYFSRLLGRSFVVYLLFVRSTRDDEEEAMECRVVRPCEGVTYAMTKSWVCGRALVEVGSLIAGKRRAFGSPLGET